MGTATLVPVEEYLNTSYEPDVDFVDGVLLRRNVGTQLHGRLQLLAGSYFEGISGSYQIKVFVETRLLVNPAPRAYRVPDVMAVPRPVQEGKAVIDVPAIIVEIKSQGTRLTRSSIAASSMRNSASRTSF